MITAFAYLDKHESFQGLAVVLGLFSVGFEQEKPVTKKILKLSMKHGT
jgi:hypothetical protein